MSAFQLDPTINHPNQILATPQGLDVRCTATENVDEATFTKTFVITSMSSLTSNQTGVSAEGYLLWILDNCGPIGLPKYGDVLYNAITIGQSANSSLVWNNWVVTGRQAEMVSGQNGMGGAGDSVEVVVTYTHVFPHVEKSTAMGSVPFAYMRQSITPASGFTSYAGSGQGPGVSYNMVRLQPSPNGNGQANSMYQNVIVDCLVPQEVIRVYKVYVTPLAGANGYPQFDYDNDYAAYVGHVNSVPYPNPPLNAHASYNLTKPPRYWLCTDAQWQDIAHQSGMDGYRYGYGVFTLQGAGFGLTHDPIGVSTDINGRLLPTSTNAQVLNDWDGTSTLGYSDDHAGKKQWDSHTMTRAELYPVVDFSPLWDGI